MQTIFKRRSIRKYMKKPVVAEDIKEILKAAMNAPSAGNAQPWQFIVIDNQQLLNKVPEIHPHAEMIKEAPIAILVCGDTSLEKYKDFWVQDCAAATENFLLAVTAKGLGSVWLGVYPRKDRVEGLRELFNIPNHVIPFSLLPVGYPAEKKEANNRYKESRIHNNTW